MTPHVQSLIDDTVVWAALALPVIFFVQYTRLHKWWLTFVGRSFVALDACVFLTFLAQAVYLVSPSFVLRYLAWWRWLDTLTGVAVVATIAYRSAALEAARRRRRASRRQTLRPLGQPNGHDDEVA